MSFLVSPQSEAMRTSEFDSSSEDEEVGEEQLTPFHVSWLVSAVFNLCDVRNVWLNVKHLCVLCLFCLLIFRLPLSIVECSQFLGICALPGKVIDYYVTHLCMLLVGHWK